MSGVALRLREGEAVFDALLAAGLSVEQATDPDQALSALRALHDALEDEETGMTVGEAAREAAYDVDVASRYRGNSPIEHRLKAAAAAVLRALSEGSDGNGD